MPHTVTYGPWPLIAQCCPPTLLGPVLPRGAWWYPHCQDLPHNNLVFSAGKHVRYSFAFDLEKPPCHYVNLEMTSLKSVSKILLSDLVLSFWNQSIYTWSFGNSLPSHYIGFTVSCNSATRASKHLQFFSFSHYSDKPGIRFHLKQSF